jgi:gliding motility-associated-like protein
MFASHIVGGDIYYDYLGNNNYRVTIILFRDCVSTGADYDNPMSLGVFDMNNNLVQDVRINYTDRVTLPVILNNPCIEVPANICTERATYTAVITLPPSVGGYNLVYQRCCRGPNISNLVSPEDTGLTLITHITGTNTNSLVNSSPRFNNYPPLVICNNDELVFDHSATDPDGDSLYYELITPFAGATDVDPMPQPPPSPPYFPINFAGGFAPINPLGPGATISINPVTGLLVADPELTGLFVVGIRVREYRNGQLIGVSDRDFLFKVVNCVIQLQANIVAQIESSNFISFCQGFDAVFENTSFGGTNYFWDFGVEGIDTDVSTDFAPSYTYPEAGDYEVTLVVNPGWPCTDTARQIFSIRENLDISFSVEDSICITGNSFDFEGIYDGPVNPIFTWNFGPNANIQTSNQLNVNNVSFDRAGVINITLNVEAGGCEGSYTDFIFIYDEPVINFDINPELKCAPYLAQFLDLSTSYAPLTYNWDFGDGNTSTSRNPSHLYETPGIYDVSLGIRSAEGCLAELTLLKEELIRVYPSPISNFTSEPLITDVFNPNFQLFDQSIDGTYLEYFYHDSVYIYERNPSLTFIESGGHTIYQVVENEFGCIDTSFITLTILPKTTIYIPNTFTPDGNKYNNTFLPIIYDALEYEITIFNRWGEEIFYSVDQKEAWDGTFKGKLCQDGLYTYKVRYKDYETNEMKTLLGHINLLR